jgi:hypothetical protein
LVIFEKGSCLIIGSVWTVTLLFMLPCIAGHCAQPLVEMGSHGLFAQAGLKPQFSLFLPPK